MIRYQGVHQIVHQILRVHLSCWSIREQGELRASGTAPESRETAFCAAAAPGSELSNRVAEFQRLQPSSSLPTYFGGLPRPSTILLRITCITLMRNRSKASSRFACPTWGYSLTDF